MGTVTVCDPIFVLGDKVGERSLLCLTGAGQARLSKGMAQFIFEGLRDQELKETGWEGQRHP